MLSDLKDTKNLLAFSAGGDSTALFFMLLDANVLFDIAIVNYGIREQSKEEVLYAQELAKKYDKKCFVYNANNIQKNFEANAREIRYNFFHDLIDKYHYKNLLTAHHLGDRFEWMLMQFCKGAGCVEIAGMQSIEKREKYNLIRPLLDKDKSELLSYLQQRDIKYFEDETNFDESIKRNSFRHKYSNPLLQKYKDGIKKSFNYIDIDKKLLIEEVNLFKVGSFFYFENKHNFRTNIYYIDKYIKEQGHLLSAKEKELLKNENTLIISRKFVVNQNQKYIFITPYISTTMDKKFKEKMRKLKIDTKLRGFFYTHPLELETLFKLFT